MLCISQKERLCHRENTIECSDTDTFVDDLVDMSDLMIISLI